MIGEFQYSSVSLVPLEVGLIICESDEEGSAGGGCGWMAVTGDDEWNGWLPCAETGVDACEPGIDGSGRLLRREDRLALGPGHKAR